MEPLKQIGVVLAALGGGALAVAAVQKKNAAPPTPDLWTVLVLGAGLGYVNWALDRHGSPEDVQKWKLLELAGLGGATAYFEGWSLWGPPVDPSGVAGLPPTPAGGLQFTAMRGPTA